MKKFVFSLMLSFVLLSCDEDTFHSHSNYNPNKGLITQTFASAFSNVPGAPENGVSTLPSELHPDIYLLKEKGYASELDITLDAINKNGNFYQKLELWDDDISYNGDYILKWDTTIGMYKLIANYKTYFVSGIYLESFEIEHGHSEDQYIVYIALAQDPDSPYKMTSTNHSFLDIKYTKTFENSISFSENIKICEHEFTTSCTPSTFNFEESEMIVDFTTGNIILSSFEVEEIEINDPKEKELTKIFVAYDDKKNYLQIAFQNLSIGDDKFDDD